MDIEKVNDIAKSDLKKNGIGSCRVLQVSLLEAGVWNLVYICDSPQKLGSHFHIYLIDNDSGQIVYPEQ